MALITARILLQKNTSEAQKKKNAKRLANYIKKQDTFDQDIFISITSKGNWNVDEGKCLQLTEDDVVRMLSITSIRYVNTQSNYEYRVAQLKKFN